MAKKPSVAEAVNEWVARSRRIDECNGHIVKLTAEANAIRDERGKHNDRLLELVGFVKHCVVKGIPTRVFEVEDGNVVVITYQGEDKPPSMRLVAVEVAEESG